MKNNKGQFEKGNVPWNTGLKLGKNPAHSLRMKGKKHTKETKQKMSKIMKEKGNRPPTQWGHKYNLGRKHTEETKKKMSEKFKGEKCYRWKGGITPINRSIRNSLEYRLWRTAVFERDNFTCVWCGDSRGGNLEADHIKPFAQYPELRFAIDNGRTLCKECHKKTDTYCWKIRWNKKL